MIWWLYANKLIKCALLQYSNNNYVAIRVICVLVVIVSIGGKHVLSYIGFGHGTKSYSLIIANYFIKIGINILLQIYSHDNPFNHVYGILYFKPLQYT